LARFGELNEYINNILMELITNKNLCKYLKYNDKTPLDNPDINGTDLLFENIFPYPYSTDVVENAISFITIHLDNFKNIDNYFKDGLISFNILINTDLWHINGGLRPFFIMQEIDNTFNRNSNIGGIGRLEFAGANLLWATNGYCGYSVKYRVLNIS
jgi:hypothetical protein